jgi:hypothetical protein
MSRISGRMNVHQNAVIVSATRTGHWPLRRNQMSNASTATPRLIDSDSDMMAKSQLVTSGSSPSTSTAVAATTRVILERSWAHSTTASTPHANVPTVHCAKARASSSGKMA